MFTIVDAQKPVEMTRAIKSSEEIKCIVASLGATDIKQAPQCNPPRHYQKCTLVNPALIRHRAELQLLRDTFAQRWTTHKFKVSGDSQLHHRQE